eukprot:m.15627 g.15627  ORF g.15627 m.15627 type:complete len:2108 (+) comp6688_c0_seq1:60-6383(+)
MLEEEVDPPRVAEEGEAGSVADSQARLRLLAAHHSLLSSTRIKCTCISVCRDWLAIGASTGGVYCFAKDATPTPKLLQLLSHKEGTVTCVKFSRINPNHLAVGTKCGVVIVWHLALEDVKKSGKRLREFKDIHKGSEVTCLEWDATGQRLFTADKSGRVVVSHVSQRTLLGPSIPSQVVLSTSSDIVQLYCQQHLLVVSSKTGTTIVNTQQKTTAAVGSRPRDGYFGACLMQSTFASDLSGADPSTVPTMAICSARPGSRMWIAHAHDDWQVSSTLKFKPQLVGDATPLEGASDLPPFKAAKALSLACCPLFPVSSLIITTSKSFLIVLNPQEVVVEQWSALPSEILQVDMFQNELAILTSDQTVYRVQVNAPTPNPKPPLAPIETRVDVDAHVVEGDQMSSPEQHAGETPLPMPDKADTENQTSVTHEPTIATTQPLQYVEANAETTGTASAKAGSVKTGSSSPPVEPTAADLLTEPTFNALDDVDLDASTQAIIAVSDAMESNVTESPDASSPPKQAASASGDLEETESVQSSAQLDNPPVMLAADVMSTATEPGTEARHQLAQAQDEIAAIVQSGQPQQTGVVAHAKAMTKVHSAMKVVSPTDTTPAPVVAPKASVPRKVSVVDDEDDLFDVSVPMASSIVKVKPKKQKKKKKKRSKVSSSSPSAVSVAPSVETTASTTTRFSDQPDVSAAAKTQPSATILTLDAEVASDCAVSQPQPPPTSSNSIAPHLTEASSALAPPSDDVVSAIEPTESSKPLQNILPSAELTAIVSPEEDTSTLDDAAFQVDASVEPTIVLTTVTTIAQSGATQHHVSQPRNDQQTDGGATDEAVVSQRVVKEGPSEQASVSLADNTQTIVKQTSDMRDVDSAVGHPEESDIQELENEQLDEVTSPQTPLVSPSTLFPVVQDAASSSATSKPVESDVPTSPRSTVNGDSVSSTLESMVPPALEPEAEPESPKQSKHDTSYPNGKDLVSVGDDNDHDLEVCALVDEKASHALAVGSPVADPTPSETLTLTEEKQESVRPSPEQVVDISGPTTSVQDSDIVTQPSSVAILPSKSSSKHKKKKKKRKSSSSHGSKSVATSASGSAAASASSSPQLPRSKSGHHTQSLTEQPPPVSATTSQASSPACGALEPDVQAPNMSVVPEGEVVENKQDEGTIAVGIGIKHKGESQIVGQTEGLQISSTKAASAPASVPASLPTSLPASISASRIGSSDEESDIDQDIPVTTKRRTPSSGSITSFNSRDAPGAEEIQRAHELFRAYSDRINAMRKGVVDNCVDQILALTLHHESVLDDAFHNMDLSSIHHILKSYLHQVDAVVVQCALDHSAVPLVTPPSPSANGASSARPAQSTEVLHYLPKSPQAEALLALRTSSTPEVLIDKCFEALAAVPHLTTAVKSMLTLCVVNDVVLDVALHTPGASSATSSSPLQINSATPPTSTSVTESRIRTESVSSIASELAADGAQPTPLPERFSAFLKRYGTMIDTEAAALHLNKREWSSCMQVICTFIPNRDSQRAAINRLLQHELKDAEVIAVIQPAFETISTSVVLQYIPELCNIDPEGCMAMCSALYPRVLPHNVEQALEREVASAVQRAQLWLQYLDGLVLLEAFQDSAYSKQSLETRCLREWLALQCAQMKVEEPEQRFSSHLLHVHPAIRAQLRRQRTARQADEQPAFGASSTVQRVASKVDGEPTSTHSVSAGNHQTDLMDSESEDSVDMEWEDGVGEFPSWTSLISVFPGQLQEQEMRLILPAQVGQLDKVGSREGEEDVQARLVDESALEGLRSAREQFKSCTDQDNSKCLLDAVIEQEWFLVGVGADFLLSQLLWLGCWEYFVRCFRCVSRYCQADASTAGPGLLQGSAALLNPRSLALFEEHFLRVVVCRCDQALTLVTTQRLPMADRLLTVWCSMPRCLVVELSELVSIICYQHGINTTMNVLEQCVALQRTLDSDVLVGRGSDSGVRSHSVSGPTLHQQLLGLMSRWFSQASVLRRLSIEHHRIATATDNYLWCDRPSVMHPALHGMLAQIAATGDDSAYDFVPTNGAFTGDEAFPVTVEDAHTHWGVRVALETCKCDVCGLPLASNTHPDGSLVRRHGQTCHKACAPHLAA